MTLHSTEQKSLMDDDDKFKAYLEDEGYFNVRKLEDGTWAGCLGLIFTTAVCKNLDEWGMGERYCFNDQALAIAECNRLKDDDSIPDGYIAKRVK